jgi:YVTN family beta-propeller protein
MKTNKKIYSLALESAALILVLIPFSSMASSFPIQSVSSTATFAYITNLGDDTVSIIDTAQKIVTDMIVTYIIESPKNSYIY